jgi:hypothetical protein
MFIVCVIYFRKPAALLVVLLIGLGAGFLWWTTGQSRPSPRAIKSVEEKSVSSASSVPTTDTGTINKALAKSPVPALVSAQEATSATRAVVTLAEDKSVPLVPNALGLYPRVRVQKGQAIPIVLTYADGEPGETLIISAEDGGKIDDGVPVKTARLDADKTGRFLFTTSQDEGVFRVTVRRGAEQTQFDFWVGAEPALQSKPASL